MPVEDRIENSETHWKETDRTDSAISESCLLPAGRGEGGPALGPVDEGLAGALRLVSPHPVRQSGPPSPRLRGARA